MMFRHRFRRSCQTIKPQVPRSRCSYSNTSKAMAKGESQSFVVSESKYKNIATDKPFSLSSRTKELQDKLESIDEDKLQKQVESIRKKVKTTVKKNFKNIFPAKRLKHFRAQQEKSGLVMDRDWWIRNLAIASLPPLMLAALCEYIKPGMEKDMENLYMKTNERLMDESHDKSVQGSGIRQRVEEHMKRDLQQKERSNIESMNADDEHSLVDNICKKINDLVASNSEESYKIIMERISKGLGLKNERDPNENDTSELLTSPIETKQSVENLLLSDENKCEVPKSYSSLAADLDQESIGTSIFSTKDQESVGTSTASTNNERVHNEDEDKRWSVIDIWNMLSAAFVIRPHNEPDDDT